MLGQASVPREARQGGAKAKEAKVEALCCVQDTVSSAWQHKGVLRPMPGQTLQVIAQHKQQRLPQEEKK